MDSEPVISVIVPVYGVEPFLDRCVSSIVNQTYKNLEIILVDDGSPDHCPVMCDRWAEKDPRIKVIHKTNGGLSDARNAGMAVANGELIGFVDSDDWISPDMYQLLYERMETDNSDIAACGVQMVWDNNTPPRMLTMAGNCVLETRDAMCAIIKETWLKQPVWYKLYRRENIQNILFPVGKYHEDVFWSYQAIGSANRVSVFDTPCYYYTQRSGSIMGERYSLKRLDGLDAKVLRLVYVQKHFPQLVSSVQCELHFSCIYAMQMCLQHLPPDDLAFARKKIKSIIESIEPLHRPRDISLMQSIWLYMSQLSFEGTCRLRNLLKIGT